jgi:hypothetical protein
MCKDQDWARSDFLSLAKFVADARATRSDAWKSVERLKLSCALEASDLEDSSAPTHFPPGAGGPTRPARQVIGHGDDIRH